MDFDEALRTGELDRARGILGAHAADAAWDDLDLREGYGELAGKFDRAGRHDDAITAMELAIEHGWRSAPDARSDIAEFHLRAGRAQQAAAIWLALREETLHDVWLFNAAGLSYSEIGEHDLAVVWLGEGIEAAMRTGDPEGLVGQLSAARRDCLNELGRDHDEIEQRVGPFLETWQDPEPRRSALLDAIEAPPAAADSRLSSGSTESGLALAISWFPAGEYELALDRWPDLAEIWADVPHAVYSGRMDGHIRWSRRDGLRVQAVAPIVVEDYAAWCEEKEVNPQDARAAYAAALLAEKAR